MKPSTKKILKRLGIIIGLLLLVVTVFGIYVYSILPKTVGKPIQLQSELFNKPSQQIPMDGKFIYKSATELESMIRQGKATSVEIVKEFIANIKNNNYKYNALIWLRENEALEDARKADEMISKGDTINKPLLGVPITIKEMYWVKGSPSTMNAKMFGFIAPEDAEIVKQVKNAGCVILGTTNVPLFLGDYQTAGEVYPTGNNPYDTTRTPGGSTGGGAAALAAGFTSVELGSDLGGSIRVPAAFCGLFGLMPTFGAINITQGAGPDTTTKYTRFALATGGPLARTVDDLKLIWETLKNTKQDDRFQHPISWKPESTKSLIQYKVAWIDEWNTSSGAIKVGSDVKTKLKQLIDSLVTNGVKLEKNAPDLFKEMKKSFLGLYASMMSEGQPWLLRKLIAMDFKKLDDGDPSFTSFYDGMDDSSDNKWNQLQADRQKLHAQWELFFKEYDFFICPITYGEAIKKCPQGSILNGDNEKMAYMNYFSYSYIFNAAGLPSVSLPMGLNKEGMPIGLQIVSSYYSEEELLRFAKLISPLTPGFIKPSI